MGLLRFLLAFSVVLAHSHAFFGFMGMGGAAVTAFFIISGFYMQLILSTKYQGLGRVWLFYSNRALRLYPIYWTILIVMFGLSFVGSGSWPLAQFAAISKNPIVLAADGSAAGIAAIIPNLFFIGADALRIFICDLSTNTLELWYRDISEGENLRGAYQSLIIPPIWSLGVEVTFYLVAPMAAMLLTRQLLILLGTVILLQFFIDLRFDNVRWIRLVAPYNLAYFVLGMLAFRGSHWVGRVGGLGRCVFFALPFALWVAWDLLLNIGVRPNDFASRWIIWPVFAASLPFVFAVSKSSSWDAKLAAYSYPVYLCHIIFA